MKKYLHEIWMATAVILILIISIVAKTEILKVVASACGVIYILGVAKEKRNSQIFGFINTAIYAYLMFNDKVFGSAIYNGLYCLPMLVYTYFSWGKEKGKKNNKIKISSYSINDRCYLIMAAIVVITIYYVVASKFGINYALADALTITCGVFGMYAISKKKIEQWYAFIIVNIANISMWIIESVNNPANVTMIALFVIYMINNIYGLFVWKKAMKNDKK